MSSSLIPNVTSSMDRGQPKKSLAFLEVTEEGRELHRGLTKQQHSNGARILRRQSARHLPRSKSAFDAYGSRGPTSVRTAPRTDREDLRSSYRAQAQEAAVMLRQTVKDDLVLSSRNTFAQPRPSNFSWATKIRGRSIPFTPSFTTKKIPSNTIGSSQSLRGQRLKDRIRSISISFTSIKRPSGLRSLYKGPSNMNNANTPCHAPENSNESFTLSKDPVALDSTNDNDPPPAPGKPLTTTPRLNFVGRGRAASLQPLRALSTLNFRKEKKTHEKSLSLDSEAPELVTSSKPAEEKEVPTPAMLLETVPKRVSRSIFYKRWDVPEDLDLDEINEAFVTVIKQPLNKWKYRPPS